MANVSAYAQKAMLDWLLGGATPTRPGSHWVGLSYGTPNSTSGSEIASAASPGYRSRATVIFGAAASPGGSASDATTVSFLAMSYASTVRGYQIWDNSTPGQGSMLWQGLLSAATLPTSASGFTCAVASALLTAL